MKQWKRIILGVLAAVGLFIAGGFLLPARVHVQRTTVVQGTPEVVFPLVATLRRWPGWTAWTTNRFPDMKTRFEGAESGVGAVMIAEGESSGNGIVTITRAEATHGVWYELNFEHGTQLFQGAVTFKPDGEALEVKWHLETDMGANPLKRWIGLLLDQLMGGDMATGLANLKQQVERQR